MVEVNGRQYQRRSQTIVGLCMDGTAPAYFEAAASVMPNLQAMLKRGDHGIASAVIPSFTNPNNLAIVTGTPPSVNGISGNYYYNRETGQEVLMNDPRDLRAQTILSAFSDAGLSVAVVTTKDKLRRLLSKGLKGICFSVECAQASTLSDNGIEQVAGLVGRVSPGVYDPEASVYCLEVGLRLIQRNRIDLVYLSTTDYVQHKYPPGSDEANHFYARIDHFLGELNAQNVILGITADHGMNAKVKPDGSPKVEFIETLLKGKGVAEARVILPITDPYVVHHGALGSYATVYVGDQNVARSAEILRSVQGVERVLSREEAVERFDLPSDRIGELVVLADRDTVLGRTPEWHDLSSVGSGLRSHGGLHEAIVPMIINRRLKPEYSTLLDSGKARNYDLFDFLCNGTLDPSEMSSCTNTEV